MSTTILLNKLLMIYCYIFQPSPEKFFFAGVGSKHRDPQMIKVNRVRDYGCSVLNGTFLQRLRDPCGRGSKKTAISRDDRELQRNSILCITRTVTHMNISCDSTYKTYANSRQIKQQCGEGYWA